MGWLEASCSKGAPKRCILRESSPSASGSTYSEHRTCNKPTMSQEELSLEERGLIRHVPHRA